MLTSEMSSKVFTPENIIKIRKQFRQIISDNYKNNVKVSRETFLAYAFVMGKKYTDVERSIVQRTCPLKGQFSFLESFDMYIACIIADVVRQAIHDNPIFRDQPPHAMLALRCARFVRKWLTEHLPPLPVVVKPKTYLLNLQIQAPPNVVMDPAEFADILAIEKFVAERFPNFTIIKKEIVASI
jgi:hypothetical protein